MSSWITTRTVVEEHAVAIARDTFTKQRPRFEELWIGISWLLARKGHELGIHRKINGVDNRLHVVGAISDSMPEVTLLYTVSDDAVVILKIGIDIGKEQQQFPLSIGKVLQEG